MIPGIISFLLWAQSELVRTRVVTKQGISKTAKSAGCEEQSLPFEGVSCRDLARFQLALQPALLGFNLRSDLAGTLPDVRTLTCDGVVAGSHGERGPRKYETNVVWSTAVWRNADLLYPCDDGESGDMLRLYLPQLLMRGERTTSSKWVQSFVSYGSGFRGLKNCPDD